MSSASDPHIRAWADQFGALIRDKVRLMQEALKVTGFNSLGHEFTDDEGDPFRLVYLDGEFVLINLREDESTGIVLDLSALGVTR